jgi:hypothetical protein
MHDMPDFDAMLSSPWHELWNEPIYSHLADRETRVDRPLLLRMVHDVRRPVVQVSCKFYCFLSLHGPMDSSLFLVVQCKQHWVRCLDPQSVKGRWTVEEDELLCSLVKIACASTTSLSLPFPMCQDFGIMSSKLSLESWVAISNHIPGRTVKQCRERWPVQLFK